MKIVSGNWTLTIDNLPLYKNTAMTRTGETKSDYEVVEILQTGVTASYSENNGSANCGEAVDVTNAYAPQRASINLFKNWRNDSSNAYDTRPEEIYFKMYLFSIETTKTWDDHDDPYGLRPTSVELKLVWSTEPNAPDDEWTDVPTGSVPGPAEDDGRTVFTTSETLQTLTKENLLDNNSWGTVVWENLPAYVLVDEDVNGTVTAVSRTVYYKVVEPVPAAISYGVVNSEAVSLESARTSVDLTASTTVENPLVDSTFIEVNKTWKNSSSYKLEDYMPLEVIIQLQYRESEEDEWKPVPENGVRSLNEDNGWHTSYMSLRADYEYRCVETELVYENKTYNVNSPDTTKLNLRNVRAWLFYCSCETTPVDDGEGNITYDCAIENKLTNRPRTGDFSNPVQLAGIGVASLVGLGGAIAVKRKKEDEDEAGKAE